MSSAKLRHIRDPCKCFFVQVFAASRQRLHDTDATATKKMKSNTGDLKALHTLLNCL